MKQLFTIIALCFLSFGYAQKGMTFTQTQMPLATDKDNLITSFVLSVKQGTEVKEISLQFKSKKLNLSELSVYVGANAKREQATLFAKTSNLSCNTKLQGNFKATNDTLFVWVSARTTQKPDLLQKLYLSKVKLTTNEAKFTLNNAKKEGQRLAIALRQRKQDGIECYRIPGLVTTNKGTLIAVYDNRYNNCKDLQEDIDVGMSRSTDGGQTWEPMKKVIDMGEWGGKPNRLNGVGDPAVW